MIGSIRTLWGIYLYRGKLRTILTPFNTMFQHTACEIMWGAFKSESYIKCYSICQSHWTPLISCISFSPSSHFFFFFFQLIFIKVWLLYNIVILAEYIKINQPCICMYIYTCIPSFWTFSHPSHHSALSRVPCAAQYVLILCLFYT